MTAARRGRPRAAGPRWRWRAPALWAAVILTATSWPNPNVPSVTHGDWAVHAALYAGLAFLVLRALGSGSRPARALAVVIVGVSLFGAVDEWHQQFIPGRSATVDDWLADSAGAVLGAFVARAWRRTQPA